MVYLLTSSDTVLFTDGVGGSGSEGVQGMMDDERKWALRR